MKIGLVGVGAVGTASLFSLVSWNVADEVVVIDKNAKRAAGVVNDLQYGTALGMPVRLRTGEYADLGGAAIVVITAGVNEKSGGATNRGDAEGRLRLLRTNADIYRDIVPRIVSAAPEAVILVVTDPPDPLAELALGLAGHGRVISTGTFLDSLRFRFHLARRLSVSPGMVEALVVGEHGTSEVFLWSGVRVGGVPLDAFADKIGPDRGAWREAVENDVRFANITIIEGTGASQLGIGMVVARLCKAILHDERVVLPVAVHDTKFGTTLSLPAILGRQGVVRTLLPQMNDFELAALKRSAGVLREAAAGVLT